MCRFFRHIVFGIESPHPLVYIGVWNKKRKNQTPQPVLSSCNGIQYLGGCTKNTTIL